MQNTQNMQNIHNIHNMQNMQNTDNIQEMVQMPDYLHKHIHVHRNIQTAPTSPQSSSINLHSPNNIHPSVLENRIRLLGNPHQLDVLSPISLTNIARYSKKYCNHSYYYDPASPLPAAAAGGGFDLNKGMFGLRKGSCPQSFGAFSAASRYPASSLPSARVRVHTKSTAQIQRQRRWAKRSCAGFSGFTNQRFPRNRGSKEKYDVMNSNLVTNILRCVRSKDSARFTIKYLFFLHF